MIAVTNDKMSKPPNPITQGLRAVTRDPAIFLVEILWRWSFALLACLLIAGVGLMLLGPLHVGNAWDTAWRSRDPQRMGQLLVAVVVDSGSQASSLLRRLPCRWRLHCCGASSRPWDVLLPSSGLRAGLTSLRFRSILALQFLRGFISWFCFVLLFAATVW